MRILTLIAAMLVLFLPFVGCSANPAAAPAAIQAAAVAWVITDPSVCDEVPLTAIGDALDDAREVVATSEALCAAVEPVPLE